MNMSTITMKSAPAIALCAVAGLALSLAFARPAAAWVDSGWGGYDSGWGDSGWDDAEQMQENAQEFQAEQDREAARSVRRGEVEEEKKQRSAETQEYYAALYDASKASLGAPKGIYYRKPGWTSSDAPPANAQSVSAGQFNLIYDNGVFWAQRANDYIVVIPPVGVVVDKLPKGVRAGRTKEGVIFYFFGVFFKGKDGKYQVVKPPAGTFVTYLPDGYTQETSKGGTIFKFGEIAFKQNYMQGVLVYSVI